MGNRLIISESEKEQILNLYKPLLSEEIKGSSYFTENPQKMYYGSNTSFDYVEIKKGTEFKQTEGGALAWGGTLVFSCTNIGTVKYSNGGTGYKNFKYKNKTYWADDLTKKLKSIFCSSDISKNNLSSGCIKGNCQNGYGEKTVLGDDVRETYKGNFKNGEYDGYGENNQTYSDGSTYTFKGNFKNGMASGTGKQEFSDGDLFYGTFLNSIRNGQGTYKWPDGSKYVGNWKDNVMNGQGTMYSDSGGVFKGNFKDGKRNGQGTYKNKNGIEFSGNWVDNTLNGKYQDDLDELTKPMTPVGSNPQVGSDVGTPQVVSPVGDDVTSPQDVKGFQDWLDLNHPGWTTNKPYQTLDKKLSRGYGKYGPLTTAAWASYKDEYLQSKPKPEGETPVETSVETPTV